MYMYMYVYWPLLQTTDDIPEDLPTPSVGLSILSWSVELEALEEADTDKVAVGGCGPATVLRLVSLADL